MTFRKHSRELKRKQVITAITFLTDRIRVQFQIENKLINYVLILTMFLTQRQDAGSSISQQSTVQLLVRLCQPTLSIGFYGAVSIWAPPLNNAGPVVLLTTITLALLNITMAWCVKRCENKPYDGYQSIIIKLILLLCFTNNSEIN